MAETLVHQGFQADFGNYAQFDQRVEKRDSCRKWDGMKIITVIFAFFLR